MQKNDKFTFQEFSRADWDTRDARARVCTYVPDEIFAPLLMTLQERADDTLAHQGMVQMNAHHFGRQTSWSWDRSLQFVSNVWHDINPEYGAVMDRCINMGYFRHVDVPYGQSRGYMHPVSHVEVFTTGTIDDPVCTVHESGHLMADQIAYNPFRSESPFNIAEIQGVFAQEHAYHLMNTRSDMQQDARVASLHRLQYHLGTLVTVPFYLAQLQDTPAKKSLAQMFGDWALPQALAQQEFPQEKTMQDLHRHPFAVLVTPVLHRLYLDADAPKRRVMREVLYEQGADSHLPGLLAAFDIHTPADVAAVGQLSAAWLADDVTRYGLSHKKAAQKFSAPPLFKP